MELNCEGLPNNNQPTSVPTMLLSGQIDKHQTHFSNFLQPHKFLRFLPAPRDKVRNRLTSIAEENKRKIVFKRHYCFPDNHQSYKYHSPQLDPRLTPRSKEVPSVHPIRFAATRHASEGEIKTKP